MYIDGVRRTCAVENLRDQDWVFHRTLPGSYSTARKQTETYGNNKWNPDIRCIPAELALGEVQPE